MSSPADLPPSQAAELAALVDTLLPGSARYPSASTVGVQWALARRWPATGQPLGLDAVLSAVANLGGPLVGLDETRKIAVVARLEALHPAAFAALRRVVYLSYYEAAAVIAAIAAQGHRYHAAPQPEGYALRPFDRERDAPQHSRGRYLSTGEVRRVDLGALAHLASGAG
jgi:hypothetical protein